MNIQVFYHSSTGNTKKLAEAIANELGVFAEAIAKAPTPLTTPIDLLFIGDGIYLGKAHKTTLAFIELLDSATIKNAAVFATYGGQDKIGVEITALLRERGITIVREPFVCKGQSWAFANRNHPNEADLAQARAFAQAALAQIEGR